MPGAEALIRLLAPVVLPLLREPTVRGAGVDRSGLWAGVVRLSRGGGKCRSQHEGRSARRGGAPEGLARGHEGPPRSST